MSNMGLADLTTIIESAMALGVILILTLRLLPDLRLDEFRQSMFIVRDELFDFAASGSISFNHPAYMLLRQSMNGFIRYGHQLTLFRLVCNMIRWKLHNEQVFSWATKWDAALKSVQQEEVRTALVNFQNRALLIAVKRIVVGSPILLSALVIMALYSMIKNGWVSIREVFKNVSIEIVNRIVDPRFLEEEAARA